jgi:F-type H+-transporting ATPase subunit a
MPEHTSIFSFLIAMFPALGENMKNFGNTAMGHPVTSHGAEPLLASLFVVLLIIGLAFAARSKVMDYKNSVVPDEKLSLRTFFELVIGMFYNMMKDMMGPKRAKRYFPVVGTAALFILFSNYLGMIPGILPPTSNLRITAGCAFVVFLAFNYYGVKENGIGYFKHLFGPWLGPIGIPINLLIFVVEVAGLIFRPITLSIRLFLNLAVDHLLLTIFTGLFMFLLPVPIMILGTLVCIVQVVVFCLLSSIYITLATEHEDHGGEHAHGKAKADGHAEAGQDAHAH